MSEPDDIEPPFSVMLRIEPPPSTNTFGQPRLIPPKGEFQAWAAELDEKVRDLGARTVPVYGHEPDILTGLPRETAYVNVWACDPEWTAYDDRGLPTWGEAFEWAQSRVAAMESFGYDVARVHIAPGRHSVAIA